MTNATSTTRRRRAWLLWAVVAVLVVVGIALLLSGLMIKFRERLFATATASEQQLVYKTDHRQLLDACEPCAAVLDCAEELSAATALAADPGDERQRRHVAGEGLAALAARLAEEFPPPDFARAASSGELIVEHR